MRDVTESVVIEAGEPEFDRARSVVTVSIRMRGKANSALRGPLRLRLSALESALGDITAINVDRGGSGVGAEWDVPGPAEGSHSPPDVFDKTLAFRLTNLKPFRQGKRFERGLVALRLIVLAPDPDAAPLRPHS